MDGGDADPGPRQLVAQGFGEAAHRELAGGVGGLARRGDDAEDAGQVDDARVTAAVEHRQEGAGHAHHAEEVDGDQPVEILLIDLLEGAAERDARVVDEKIEAAVLAPDRRRQRHDGIAVADVEPVPCQAQARPAGQLRGVDQVGLVDVDEGEMHAPVR